MATTMIHVRLDTEMLLAIEKIGREIKPKPLNRSEMINVAVRDYVERNAAQDKKGKGKP